MGQGGMNPVNGPTGGGFGHRERPGTAVDVVALAAAVLIAALLAFAAFTKFYSPNPKQLMLDYSTGALESLVSLLLLVFHRRWVMWGFLAAFFGTMVAYALYKSLHGEPCGCFANFWEPPKFFTVALDGVIVVASLALMISRGAPRGAVIGAVVIALAGAGGGWVLAQATTPPKRIDIQWKHGGKTAVQRLVESPLMADIRGQEEGGPSWLVFCFDPTCHICEAMKPLIEFRKEEFAETGDPVLQIRSFSVPEMEKSVGIENYAWETPTLFVFKNGRVTRSWSGKTLEGFTPERLQEIYDKVASGEFDEPENPTTPAPPTR